MKTFAAALLLTLTGCAAVAPSQSYRPANFAGAPLSISGQYSDLSNAVEITINGKNVTSGTLSFFGGNGEFSGEYEGRPVNASCVTSVGLWGPKPICYVFINGERAATLSF